MKLLYSYHDSLGPVGRTIDADEAYGIARPAAKDPRGNRPWVGMCMVASIDGSTVVNGNSLALSSPADRAVLVALRRVADTVVVGAGTVRDEGYGPPSKAGQRIAVVSGSGRVDTTTPLFTSGSGYLVTSSSNSELDLFAAVAAMQGTYVQLEGGATLNAAMCDAQLVDEINLTVSPHVTGGSSPRVTRHAPDLFHRYDLHHVLEEDGYLFLRYVRSNTKDWFASGN